MRTLEEIRKDVTELITRCPGVTENEIMKQLHLSQRFTRKLLDQMVYRGELCQN
jgi:predicted DNA-binding transcriptional regulator